MKVKVWLDSSNKLLHWANASDSRPLGISSDGYEVIEVTSTEGLYEGHATVVDGVLVPEAGYTPDKDIPESAPSINDQITQLQESNNELQSALLELSDLVLQGGNIS